MRRERESSSRCRASFLPRSPAMILQPDALGPCRAYIVSLFLALQDPDAAILWAVVGNGIIPARANKYLTIVKNISTEK